MEAINKITGKTQDVFQGYGNRNINIDEIAANLDTSNTAVRQRYSTRDDLLEALVELRTEEHARICNMLTANREDVIMELFFILLYSKNLYKKLGYAVIQEIEKSNASAHHKFMVHKNEFSLPKIKANLMRGINEGFYKDDFSTDTIARFMVESIAIASNTDIFPSAEDRSKKTTEEIFGFLINGIVTAAGKALIGKYKNQHGIMSLVRDSNQPFWDH